MICEKGNENRADQRFPELGISESENSRFLARLYTFSNPLKYHT